MATEGPEIREFDPEWLVRRGNYLTLITPEIATELLERNTNNRRPKPRAIQKYARDMRAGNWDPDASDVKVARTGELIDGQNRLLACQEAGVPFPTLLRTGVSTKAKAHVDLGVSRTLADSLAMEGVSHNTAVAAAVGLRNRYERQLTEGGTALSRAFALTNQESLDYLRKHPSLVEFATDGKRCQQVAPAIPPSVWVAGLSMMAESNTKRARHFANQFVDGDTYGVGDPLLALVRYTALHRQNKVGSPGGRGLLAAQRHLLALIKTWNAWRQDEKVDRLTVRDNEPPVPAD